MKENIKKKYNEISKIKSIVEKAIIIVIADYSKTKSLDINNIRKILFKESIIIKVTKNKLLKKIFENTINSNLIEYLKGQNILIISDKCSVSNIKKINDIKNEYENFKVKVISFYNKIFLSDKFVYLENLPEYPISLKKLNITLKKPIIIFTKYLKLIIKNEILKKTGDIMTSKINDIIEAISTMNMLEIVELTKNIEKRFDLLKYNLEEDNKSTQEIKNEAPKEKTEFSVIMTNYGDNKLNIIKIIRTILNLGLKEAKDFVENLPATIKENIQKEDAENIKNRLEESGAKIELK